MKGSVVKRKGPRGTVYYAVLHKGNNQYSWTRFDSSGDAWAFIHDNAKNAATLPAATRQTVAEYLTSWLTRNKPKAVSLEAVGREQPQRRITTWSRYEIICRKYAINQTPDSTPINPQIKSLGHIRLDKLTYKDVIAFYKSLEDNAGISSTTRLHIHRALHTMFGDAVPGTIRTNPCAKELIKNHVPAQSHFKPAVWTEEQASRFRAAAKTSLYHEVYLFMLDTGARSAEVSGLTWGQVNLPERNVTIDRQLLRVYSKQVDQTAIVSVPKSDYGVRVIPLTRELHTVLAELKLRRSTKGDTDNVFTTPSGTPIRMANVFRRDFPLVCKAATKDGRPTPVPILRPHDFRRACAKFLAQSDTDITTISRILGHSSTRVTEGYLSSDETTTRAAMDRMEARREAVAAHPR